MLPEHFRFHPLASTALALCGFGLAQAQTAPTPNAGQILRELQTPPPLAPAGLAAQRAEPAAETGADDQVKVRVTSVVFTGNEVIATSDLLPLVSSLVGSEQTLGQLNAAARRVTAYYRSRGFAVARALLPAQDITSGTLTISVIEGRVASSRLANTSRLSDALVGAYIGEVKPGDVIRSSRSTEAFFCCKTPPVSRHPALPCNRVPA